MWQRGAPGLACVWEVNTEASCWQSWNTDQTFAEPPVVLGYVEVQLSRTERGGGGRWRVRPALELEGKGASPLQACFSICKMGILILMVQGGADEVTQNVCVESRSSKAVVMGTVSGSCRCSHIVMKVCGAFRDSGDHVVHSSFPDCCVVSLLAPSGGLTAAWAAAPCVPLQPCPPHSLLPPSLPRNRPTRVEV